MSARVNRLRRPTPALRLVAIVVSIALALAGMPMRVQAQANLPLIRDAEIEQLLREYTAPVLRVAGLAQQNVHVVIINERAFNAFVVDGKRIFINVGALMDAKTPNEIIGVLAHETGHIAGGHLTRLREELAHAQTATIIAMLIGVGAAIASSRAGGANSGAGSIGGAALTAPQSIIERNLLSYVRAQEEQADKAGVKFLTMTQQSPKGMYDTFKRFADKIEFQTKYIDPYLQTHPMPKERMEALAEIAKSSPYWDKKDPPELQARHDMMRAKLSGFLERPDTVAHRYPASDTSLPARYARAISAYRYGDIHSALSQIDALIHAQPNNPYFHELKGQALLEGGHPAEAVAPLRRAGALAPNAMLIRIMLGQALVATNQVKDAEEAIPLLRTAVIREPEMADGYSQLAMAYGRKGDLAEADLAAAQAAFASGDYRTARDLATRAKTRFPTGSPGWVRADDIVTYKPPPGATRHN
ncbi:MAG: M48 family metallopeptidase [Hyphomicrobiales bacterium]|nr:M48 family metallopeptidase [Hyphomicrobiales bacterium]MBV8823542.1 M48 family metallopeptidase [Hyphomicrobiales bacterium]MBV9428838.1 M48 family metallopeptidase [Bradyrhizobiaceae bacterium]